jgi:hypothetical protein
VLMRRAKVTTTANGSSAVADAGGYEESKTNDQAKRRRGDLLEDGNEGNATKRSRTVQEAEVSVSQELMNDLEDSDDEGESCEGQAPNEKMENIEGSVTMEPSKCLSAAAEKDDMYSRWQSSDDIEWELIVSSTTEEDEVK